ncbi:MAG: SDR family oxidoreductase [Burkholderiaceae bacterium]
MDFGISGRWAIVCAASKGLGYGCAQALADEGVNLVINARSGGPLDEAAARLRERAGVEVRAVAADITTAKGRASVLEACPQPDILVNNAGGPPPGDFRDFSRDDWVAAVDANMVTPIELIKAVIDPMIERRFGRIVNITSSSVKAPLPALGLSNGARAGLTGFVAGLARQCASHGVTINNLLPGAFDTDRLRGNFKSIAAKGGQTEEQAAAARLATIPARRFGTAEEFGQACAFICSRQASYFTGQNFLIDGGAYPGTF